MATQNDAQRLRNLLRRADRAREAFDQAQRSYERRQADTNRCEDILDREERLGNSIARRGHRKLPVSMPDSPSLE